MMNLTDPIYTDENKARKHLEAIRWPDGPICPHCGVVDTAHRIKGKSARPGLWFCADCRKQFTVTVGTLFERSKVPLHKWLLANHLICASKKGMSAHQLHRMLGVTYKTAWFMAHRIREAMRDNPELSGPIVGSPTAFAPRSCPSRATPPLIGSGARPAIPKSPLNRNAGAAGW